MVKFIFFGFDIIKFLSFLDNTYLYVINSLKKVINLFLIRFRTRNRPKNIKTFCFSNPIELRKMTDIIYSFEKLGKWKKLKERLKLIRIYKRNSWWSCTSILACRYKSKMVFDNVMKFVECERKTKMFIWSQIVNDSITVSYKMMDKEKFIVFEA